ncbi:MAG: CAP domain-containing protein [Actinomycetaceae bacterium]|nr:CAP domain-containing protein [Actinomycetaceae bacterium]
MRAQVKYGFGALAGCLAAVLLGSMFAPGMELATTSGSTGSLSAGLSATSAQGTGEIQAPAGPYANQINTSNKGEVQRAFLERFNKNDKRVAQAQGTDLAACEPGTVIPDGIAPMVESWNFLRGLNGLNAVYVDTNSPITSYAMAAAMTQARNGKLSHYPTDAGFACVTEAAERGSRHGNLAQSTGHSPAQQILWYYIDFSAQDNPVNDTMGHRLFMQDPQLSQSGIGVVDGFTAIQVRTGEDYPGIAAAQMQDASAPTPDWMSWPSQGFFPKDLLPSLQNGVDMERWSFSVHGGDLSEANATITGPDGAVINTIVVRPGQPGIAYTPRDIADYSTLLMKMAPLNDSALPVGQENKEYTVHITGVKGTAQSEYTYQVVLFDPHTPLTNEAPEIYLPEQPLSGTGYKMTSPIPVEISGWPTPTVQWQERINGGAWTDIAGANSDDFIPAGGWDVSRAKATEFRVVATNELGETVSPPIKVAVQGIEAMPESKTAAIGETVTWEAKALVDLDGRIWDTHYEWQFLAGNQWQTLPEDGHFQGTKTSQLTVNGVSAADNGLQIRVVIRSRLYELSGWSTIMVWSDGNAALNVS